MWIPKSASFPHPTRSSPNSQYQEATWDPAGPPSHPPSQMSNITTVLHFMNYSMCTNRGMLLQSLAQGAGIPLPSLGTYKTCLSLWEELLSTVQDNCTVCTEGQCKEGEQLSGTCTSLFPGNVREAGCPAPSSGSIHFSQLRSFVHVSMQHM